MKHKSNNINPPGLNDFMKGPIVVDPNELPENLIVNSYIKDTFPDDKPVDTSLTPINKIKEKKPKYSQVNSKLSGSIRNSKKNLHTPEKEPIIVKKKKKLVYRENFLDIVDVESYKKYNKAMTWPDGIHFDEPEEDQCRKYKECFEKTCLII